jgi:uncharacterized membrane protein
MDRRIVTLALAGSLASALAAMAVPAFAGPVSAADAVGKEKCFGIALKGQNDCAAGAHDCAGHSTIDYDKASFKLVPAGTCHTIKGTLKPGKA